MQPRSKVQARILSSIIKDTNGCWLWQRHISSTGYGQMWLTTAYQKGSTFNAHRVSYEHFRAKIAPRLQLDHLCKVRSCVNPDHLEAVTARENVNRSNAHYKQLRTKTHCLRGHEFSKENTRERPNKWGGINRTCLRCEYQRQWSRYIKVNPDAVQDKNRPAQLAARTHCRRGHKFSPDNTYVYKTGRKCKTCNTLKNKGLLYATA